MKTHFYSIHCNNFLYNNLYDVSRTRCVNVGVETKTNTMTLYIADFKHCNGQLRSARHDHNQPQYVLCRWVYSFLATPDRQETIEPQTSTTRNHTHDVHGTNEPSPESHRSSTGRGVRTIGLIMKTSAVFFTRSSPR